MARLALHLKHLCRASQSINVYQVRDETAIIDIQTLSNIVLTLMKS
jgi:hypothetical protein